MGWLRVRGLRLLGLRVIAATTTNLAKMVAMRNVDVETGSNHTWLGAHCAAPPAVLWWRALRYSCAQAVRSDVHKDVTLKPA